MAKIPFDIKYRPQIESGEYKVETRGGAPVHILSFEALGPFPICYQVGDGMDADFPPRPEVYFANNNGECPYTPNSLFIVTSEELTKFERTLKSGTNIYVEQGRRMEDWDAKADAKDLMEIARKELQREIDAEIKEDPYLEI